MSEPVDPLNSLGRAVAYMLAVLIGVSLALHPLDGDAPAPAPSPAPSESTTAAPDSADFETLLTVLVERSRDGLQRHGDFKIIAAALMADETLLLREDTNRDEAAPPTAEVAALRGRIERGEARAYGWAETMHAPGEKNPDAVFIEIGYDNGRIKRRVMHFGRTAAGTLEFYSPGPVSQRPGPAFVSPSPSPMLAPASPAPAPPAVPPALRFPPGVPRVDASPTPQSTEK